MVLSLLISFGTAVGAHEGIKASMAKSRKEEHRSRKNNLIVHCPKSSQYSPYLEGRRIVLSGDRLFIDTGTIHDAPFGHPFEGYYIPYPDSKHAGLVTTITHEAPIMNWVFVDPVTYALRFGVRAVADGNLTGPFDCTRQDRRLTFCGWEGFCAVLEDSGVWGLYFDRDGDGLRRMFGQEGRVVIEIELTRSELRTPKPDYSEPEPEADTSHQQAWTSQKEAERPVEASTISPDTTRMTDIQNQADGVTLEEGTNEKKSPILVQNQQDQDVCSVFSEALSTESAKSGTTEKRGRRRRSRGAKKHKSPTVETSE